MAQRVFSATLCSFSQKQATGAFLVELAARHYLDVVGNFRRQEAAMGYVLFLAVIVASLFIVDYLARERGWNRSRWQVAALTIGPLAIPLVYLADAAYAVTRMIGARRP
jgi:hypothetical protein